MTKMKLTKNFLLKEDIAEQNAIFSAIENENEGEVKSLLDSGTDPNTRNELNQTPLHFAYVLSADVIQALITKGADVNAIDDSKKTPLHMASFFRDFDAMKLLLTNGAKVNAQDMSANTPLINFCERSNKNRYPDEGVSVENKKKCFDLLVEAKADMNLKNKRGLSPLYIAYYYEDAELVNWLIGAGADVEKEGTEIKDGIKRFIAKNKTVTESKKQIKEANETGEIEKQQRELWGAIDKHDINTFKNIINQNKNLITSVIAPSISQEGYYPIHLVCLTIYYSMIDKNIKTEQVKILVEMLKFLIENGADKNIKSTKGKLPIDLLGGVEKWSIGDIPKELRTIFGI